MNEYPIPRESNIIPASREVGGLHSCILRKSCKPEFLHLEREL
jgi:hypothetical protein